MARPNYLSNMPKLQTKMYNSNSDINGFRFIYPYHGIYYVVCENRPKLSSKLQYYKILLMFWKSKGKPLEFVANKKGFADLNGHDFNVENEIRNFFDIKSSIYGPSFNMIDFYEKFNNSIKFTKHARGQLSKYIDNTIDKRYPKYKGRNYCFAVRNNNGYRSEINNDKARLHCRNLYDYIIPHARHGARGISFLFSVHKEDEKTPNEIIKNAIENGVINNNDDTIPNTNN